MDEIGYYNSIYKPEYLLFMVIISNRMYDVDRHISPSLVYTLYMLTSTY